MKFLALALFAVASLANADSFTVQQTGASACLPGTGGPTGAPGSVSVNVGASYVQTIDAFGSCIVTGNAGFGGGRPTLFRVLGD
jgi:hypothetical protein